MGAEKGHLGLGEMDRAALVFPGRTGAAEARFIAGEDPLPAALNRADSLAQGSLAAAVQIAEDQEFRVASTEPQREHFPGERLHADELARDRAKRAVRAPHAQELA